MIENFRLNFCDTSKIRETFWDYLKHIVDTKKTAEETLVNAYKAYAGEFFKGCPENMLFYSPEIRVQRYSNGSGYRLKNTNLPVIPELFNSFETYTILESSLNNAFEKEIEAFCDAVDKWENADNLITCFCNGLDSSQFIGTLSALFPKPDNNIEGSAEKQEEEFKEFYAKLTTLAEEAQNEKIAEINAFLEKDYDALLASFSDTTETSLKTVETITTDIPTDGKSGSAVEENVTETTNTEEEVTEETAESEDYIAEPPAEEYVPEITEVQADEEDYEADEVIPSDENETESEEDYALAAEGDQLCFEF